MISYEKDSLLSVWIMLYTFVEFYSKKEEAHASFFLFVRKQREVRKSHVLLFFLPTPPAPQSPPEYSIGNLQLR